MAKGRSSVSRSGDRTRLIPPLFFFIYVRLPVRRRGTHFYYLMNTDIKISDYDYDLPDGRIAKFPLEHRDASKLLVSRGGSLSQRVFRDIGSELPDGALLVFNNTKVVRARIVMHKPSGARIEVFCLEPHSPADYERAFAVKGRCEWKCIIGNSKKWKEGPLGIVFEYDGAGAYLQAFRAESEDGSRIVRFEWNADMTFGQLLEYLGRVPIPPYLGRDSEEIDNSRYQTVYSRFEGSVAAPTAGLHFSEGLMAQLRDGGVAFDEVTLHVGAGTFLPVKSESVAEHEMHTEHFDITLETVENLLAHKGKVVAVGTTTVRTLESLVALGYRIMRNGDPDVMVPVDQWELYFIPDKYTGEELLTALAEFLRGNGGRLKTATRIMIMPGFRFRVVDMIVTNFHQPKSTLLLLVSAFVGGHWHEIYDYALANGFRFLSYGDSSLLVPAGTRD